MVARQILALKIVVRAHVGKQNYVNAANPLRAA